jgi:hypothetical protein
MFDFSNRLILKMADCLIQNFQKAVLSKISSLQKKVEHGVKGIKSRVFKALKISQDRI